MPKHNRSTQSSFCVCVCVCKLFRFNWTVCRWRRRKKKENKDQNQNRIIQKRISENVHDYSRTNPIIIWCQSFWASHFIQWACTMKSTAKYKWQRFGKVLFYGEKKSSSLPCENLMENWWKIGSTIELYLVVKLI